MKIVIFGTGKYFCERKTELLSYTDAVKVAFIDNNQQKQGTYIDGIPVLAVEDIVTLDFDKVVLMSVRAGEMKEQLIKIGIEREKIWSWERFRGENWRGSFRFYCQNQKKSLKKDKILIITPELNYNGGTLAAVYAGMELQRRGYVVVLAAPGGNDVFIREVKKEGIDIMICHALPCLFSEELVFVEQFDIVLVNVFKMISCAYVISRIKPVIWWIHEPSIFYESALVQYSDYATTDWMEQVYIYAVSRIAQCNFNRLFLDKIKDTLAYGIPDKSEYVEINQKRRKMVYAVIGSITPVKGQDIFLKAINKIEDNQKSYLSFWIIGKEGEDSYYNDIKNMAVREPSVKLLGEMTREEIQSAYAKIDVLVCPSREDTLSIVVTEAMMYGKVCIVSDSVGMADYILHGENGFVYKTGNVTELFEKIMWTFEHKDKLRRIGDNARLTYQEKFSMDSFGNRLEMIIDKIKKDKKALVKDLCNEIV